MRYSELENKWSDNCINRCSSNVPFNKISSGEESNLVFNKKLTKDPTIDYWLVHKTYQIWDYLNSTGIGRKYFEYGGKGIEKKA